MFDLACLQPGVKCPLTACCPVAVAGPGPGPCPGPGPGAQVDTGLHAAVAAQLTATTLPEYYSLPDIPLLVTEDDVGFAPDMGMRLSRVSNRVLLDVGTWQGWSGV